LLQETTLVNADVTCVLHISLTHNMKGRFMPSVVIIFLFYKSAR
jgi:hypothetical protein